VWAAAGLCPFSSSIPTAQGREVKGKIDKRNSWIFLLRLQVKGFG